MKNDASNISDKEVKNNNEETSHNKTSSQGNVDSSNNLINEEEKKEPQIINLQKIFAVILIVAFVALIIIVGDEVSGKNKLNRFFTYLQNKIETLIGQKEEANDYQNYQNYLHSLNVKNNNSTNKTTGSPSLIDDSVFNVYKNEEALSNQEEKSNNVNSKLPSRNILDYDKMTEEQLIEAIDKDFQNDCNYYNQNSLVNSMVVKPFVTKIAIDKGYDNLMDKLCKKDYHPKNDKSNFNTLNTLAYATEQNSKKCIDVLIKNGADLKVEQENGKTLLHSAAQAGNIGFARKLLRLGIPLDKETKENNTPLFYAVKNNKHEMAFYLMNCGAKLDKNLKNETQDSYMIRFLENGKPSWRETKLSPEDSEWAEAYEYIKEGKLEELKTLVKNGKDLLKMTVGGEPAPCIAAYFKQYEIMNFLIHEYDCRNLVDYHTGRNALHYAVKQSDSKMVDLLLQNGFDPNFPDLYYYTPLHHAVYNPNSDCLLVLLHNGADPDSQNLKKQTPLHLAVMAGNNLAIKLFLDEGANMNLQDYQGNTVLHYFSEYSSDKKLLDIIYKHEEKLDFTIKNNEGKTPKDIDNSDSFNNYEKYFKKLNKLKK